MRLRVQKSYGYRKGVKPWPQTSVSIYPRLFTETGTITASTPRVSRSAVEMTG